MTAVPVGWRVVRLDEVAGKPQYGWTSSARPGAPGPPLLRTTDITRGRITWDSVPRCVELPSDPSRYLLADNDIVVSRAGSVGVSALLVEPPRAVFASYLMRLRPGPDVLPSFLALFLRSPQYWSQVSDMTNGIAMPNINGTKLAAVMMPLPPLEEQRRILDVLEGHLSRLDAAAALLAKTAARRGRFLEAWLASQTSLSRAEQRPLYGLLASPLRHGRSVPTAESGFPVLRLTALAGPRVDLTQRKIGAWDAEQATPFLVTRGDFLVARGSGSLHLVGRGSFVDEEPDPVAYPDTAIRVRLSAEQMTPAFLALIWSSRAVRSQIEAVAKTTAGIHKINQAHLGRVQVPVPSLEEQWELVRRADESAAASQRLHVAIKGAQVRGSALRRSLLSSAFSGHLTSSPWKQRGSPNV